MEELSNIDFVMLTFDLLIFMVMSSMLRYSYSFIKISTKYARKNNEQIISQMHFQDHAVAVAFSLVGSAIGTVSSVFHIIQQHIFLVDSYWSEISLSVAFSFLAVSWILIMRHMICEETPGHPYYVQENQYSLKDTK